MIFDTFDTDQDGFWNEREMCEFMSEIGLSRLVPECCGGRWIQLKRENQMETKRRDQPSD